MTREIRITAVSYLNTVPFLYGIEHADDLRAELSLSPPSQCAAAFRNGAADVALVPVAAIHTLAETLAPPVRAVQFPHAAIPVSPAHAVNSVFTETLASHAPAVNSALAELATPPEVAAIPAIPAIPAHPAHPSRIAMPARMAFPDARIVTDYCIGAVGSVRTVVLVSNVPLGQIRHIWLDPHSLTSAQLVRVLARERWRIDPLWHDLDDYARIDNPAPDDAFLLIGDKVFAHEGRFAHCRDLADDWREWTGLPFVFAVWVARPEVPEEVIAQLNAALKYGVAHIPQAVARYGHDAKPYAVDYLTRNIDFLFDAPKRKAFGLFRDKSADCRVRSKPG